jgi:hypothetical protein
MRTDEQRNRDRRYFNELNPVPTEADYWRTRCEALAVAARALALAAENVTAEWRDEDSELDAWERAHEVMQVAVDAMYALLDAGEASDG